MNCHLWEFFKLIILSGICALCGHVCLPAKEIFFPVDMWRHITVVEGACWLWMVRDTEKCFMPKAAASKTPIPVLPFKNHVAHLAGKSAEKVYLGGVGIFIFLNFSRNMTHCFILFVWSLFLWSIFGINWQCGLSDVGFWMGLWMWEVVTFWKRHSSIGQQTQVTSWESIWYDW